MTDLVPANLPEPPAPAPVFAAIPIHGRPVLAARDGDVIRVPMRGFCAAIGIPWEPQRKRINRDPLLQEGTSMMAVPTAGGMQQQVTLRAELIAGFLFGCDQERFAPELRDRVELFRRECFAVLHAHFAGAERTAALPAAELAQLRRTAGLLVQQLVETTAPAARRHLHALLVQCCADLGVEAPALAAIGVEAPSLTELVVQLREAGRVLDARRRRWNHAAGARLALQLPELARLFAAADVDYDVAALQIALEAGSTEQLRVTRRTIDSAITHRPVFAWVIEEWR